MGNTEIYYYIIAGGILLFILMVGIVLFITQYRKRKLLHIKETEMLNEKHTAELLTTQLEMQTQTMQYIGREIHDNVGQKLTLASLYTQQLAYENKAPQVNDTIENISNIINESLAELRQLSKSLTDDTIANTDTSTLIQQECDKANDVKKCHVSFRSNIKTLALPYQSKSILVRIVQEFLQNSMKHSNCKNILVSLNGNDTILQLHLQDDGQGFDTATVTGKGIGLSNMKKRTELIGGTYSLDSLPGKGTQLNIEIPLTQHQ